MALYKTLSGESFDLNKLTTAHKDVLKKLFTFYSQGCPCHIYHNTGMNDPEIMKALGCEFINGQYWLDSEITGLAIFKIIEDMWYVLAIRQGKIAEEDTSYMEENEKTLREFLQ